MPFSHFDKKKQLVFQLVLISAGNLSFLNWLTGKRYTPVLSHISQLPFLSHMAQHPFSAHLTHPRLISFLSHMADTHSRLI